MSHFLKKCGEDEALHAQLMVRAAESLKLENPEPTSVIELDHELCERIEKQFLEGRGRSAIRPSHLERSILLKISNRGVPFRHEGLGMSYISSCLRGKKLSEANVLRLSSGWHGAPLALSQDSGRCRPDFLSPRA
jgi:hypothetical protein